MRFLALLSAILISYSSSAAPPGGALKLAIEEAVKAELLEPSTATFMHLNYGGGSIYCGYVTFAPVGKRIFRVKIEDPLRPVVSGALVSLVPGPIERSCQDAGAL